MESRIDISYDIIILSECELNLRRGTITDITFNLGI